MWLMQSSYGFCYDICEADEIYENITRHTFVVCKLGTGWSMGINWNCRTRQFSTTGFSTCFYFAVKQFHFFAPHPNSQLFRECSHVFDKQTAFHRLRHDFSSRQARDVLFPLRKQGRPRLPTADNIGHPYYNIQERVANMDIVQPLPSRRHSTQSGYSYSCYESTRCIRVTSYCSLKKMVGNNVITPKLLLANQTQVLIKLCSDGISVFPSMRQVHNV